VRHGFATRYVGRVLAGSRSQLQVSFAGETGHGDGVTRGFYVAVAEAAQSRRLNVGMVKVLCRQPTFNSKK
jgi:predicted RNA-binding protein with TRAM domain